uniref:(northern house mosquito) hypothetical protein n=1 Tax=Culex pipiens TaxID=7175 RepID=A0A8D8KYA6_CULPI
MISKHYEMTVRHKASHSIFLPSPAVSKPSFLLLPFYPQYPTAYRFVSVRCGLMAYLLLLLWNCDVPIAFCATAIPGKLPPPVLPLAFFTTGGSLTMTTGDGGPSCWGSIVPEVVDEDSRLEMADHSFCFSRNCFTLYSIWARSTPQLWSSDCRWRWWAGWYCGSGPWLLLL